MLKMMGTTRKKEREAATDALRHIFAVLHEHLNMSGEDFVEIVKMAVVDYVRHSAVENDISQAESADRVGLSKGQKDRWGNGSQLPPEPLRYRLGEAVIAELRKDERTGYSAKEIERLLRDSSKSALLRHAKTLDITVEMVLGDLVKDRRVRTKERRHAAPIYIFDNQNDEAAIPSQEVALEEAATTMGRAFLGYLRTARELFSPETSDRWSNYQRGRRAEEVRASAFPRNKTFRTRRIEEQLPRGLSPEAVNDAIQMAIIYVLGLAKDSASDRSTHSTEIVVVTSHDVDDSGE